MGCCGDSAPIDIEPLAGQPGDVLVAAVWMGNRIERGRITGRVYPRAGNGALLYIDPRDQQAAPHLWRLVERVPQPEPRSIPEPEPEDPDFLRVPVPADMDIPHANGLRELMALMYPNIYGAVAQQTRPLSPGEIRALSPAGAPDVATVLRLARHG